MYGNKLDDHLCCFSYPNCDEAPLGCSFATKDPEPYGHRDAPEWLVPPNGEERENE